MIKWLIGLFRRAPHELSLKVELKITGPITIHLDDTTTTTPVQVYKHTEGLSHYGRRPEQGIKAPDFDSISIQLRSDLPTPEASFGEEVGRLPKRAESSGKSPDSPKGN